MRTIWNDAARLALIACLPLLVLTTPAAAQEGEPEPEAAAETWLALLDGGEFTSSWEEAAHLFQQAVSAQDWAQQAGLVRQQVGEVVARDLVDVQQATDPDGVPPGEYANVRYDSEFGTIGKAIEVVSLVREAERGWRVAGYFVQPPAGE
jgi:hypothetical protein